MAQNIIIMFVCKKIIFIFLSQASASFRVGPDPFYGSGSGRNVVYLVKIYQYLVKLYWIIWC